MRDPNFSLTKRHLGILAVIAGLAALIGVLIYDAIGLGNTDVPGFGPSQKAALVVAMITLIIGLTLIPLGDQPA